jgi:hypothetical protein
MAPIAVAALVSALSVRHAMVLAKTERARP